MDQTLKDKYSLTVHGDSNQTLIPGVVPYSEYNLAVSVFNGRGSGPGSKPVTFRTPEGGERYPGDRTSDTDWIRLSSSINTATLKKLKFFVVPGKISILKATNAQSNSITLVWVPPLKANGILTGYLLQYQISKYAHAFSSHFQ